MSDGFATAKIEVQQAGMVFGKRKPKLVVHIRESTWVRRHATSFGVREHLPGILYRSVIYGYFIIIGHLLLRSVPGYSNNMAYLRRYAEWVVLEKIRDNSLGENETESRPKNKYPRFLYPISSFVDITLGSWPSSHLTRMNDYFWQSKWTHHGDNLLSTFSVHTPPAGHNSPPFKIARSNVRNQLLAAMTSWGRNKRSIDEHAYAWRIFAAGIRAPASGTLFASHPTPHDSR